MIGQLPTELITSILVHLDSFSLLTCKRVNRLFLSIVTQTPLLQYIITLGIAGQIDAPKSDRAVGSKLDQLRAHIQHWNQLKWTDELFMPMSRGGLWELYGNVLAQNSSIDRSFTFRQLPSKLRGIETREWSIRGPGFTVRDFGMDPAQDLLVFIENPKWSAPRNPNYRFHLRKLSDGGPHPSAVKRACIDFRQEIRDVGVSYTVQISGPYFGVHILYSAQNTTDEVLIWNWKTGDLKMHVTGDEMHAFAFLSEKHIIVTVMESSQFPYLKVLDFDAFPVKRNSINLAPYVAQFSLPELSANAEPGQLNIRCDPSPTWAPHSDVPFYTCPENRLYVVTLWVHTSIHNTYCYAFLIPLSTFMTNIDHTRNSQRVAWNSWGPDGCRLIHLPHGQSNVWVCYVFGSKYIVPRVYGELDADLPHLELVVYDLNQAAVKYAQIVGPKGEGEDVEGRKAMELVTEALTIDSGQDVFTEPVETRLPYRKGAILADQWRQHLTAVLISEDCVVLVSPEEPERRYTILSF